MLVLSYPFGWVCVIKKTIFKPNGLVYVCIRFQNTCILVAQRFGFRIVFFLFPYICKLNKPKNRMKTQTVKIETELLANLTPFLQFAYNDEVRERLALFAVHIREIDPYETTQESASQLLQFYQLAVSFQSKEKYGFAPPELALLFAAVIQYVNQNHDVLSRIADGSLISQGTPEFRESFDLYLDCLANFSEEQLKEKKRKVYRTNEEFFKALYGEDI